MNQPIDLVNDDTVIAALVGKRMMLPIDQTLYIVVASPGGEYEPSLMLAKFIQGLPNTQIFCRYCASAAGMIFTDSGLHRLVSDKSSMIMHELYAEHVTAAELANPEFSVGVKSDSETFNELIYKHLGISKSEYEAKILNKEWNVKGKDLVKLHLADELVNVKCDRFEATLLLNTCS